MAKKATADDKTLQLIQEVTKQKKEIATAERSRFVTNCNFSYFVGSPNVINLHVESSVETLVKIVAFLLERVGRYDEAAKFLGIESPPPFTWQGFPVSDWIADVKTRLGKVQIEAKKKKLEALEARLNSIVSPELRAQMELEAIERELL